MPLLQYKRFPLVLISWLSSNLCWYEVGAGCRLCGAALYCVFPTIRAQANPPSPQRHPLSTSHPTMEVQKSEAFFIGPINVKVYFIQCITQTLNLQIWICKDMYLCLIPSMAQGLHHYIWFYIRCTCVQYKAWHKTYIITFDYIQLLFSSSTHCALPLSRSEAE